MRIIHCTQKLLKEMGNPSLVDIHADIEGLGNWYANIIRIVRNKCLLFTNEKTLYSFLIPNVRKANLQNIVDEFLVNLSFTCKLRALVLMSLARSCRNTRTLALQKPQAKRFLVL